MPGFIEFTVACDHISLEYTLELKILVISYPPENPKYIPLDILLATYLAYF